MRVISQDGTMDFPYNLFCFTIRTYDYDCCIVAYPISHPNNSGTILATYSTEEKAKKAIDLLHETYVGKLFLSVNENVEFDNTTKELLKNATILCTPNVDVRPIGDSRNAVFRFPADDEV